MSKIIKIHSSDNLIVALENLNKGEVFEIDGQKITLSEDIQQKHKFSIKPLKKGDPLLMYGVKVGVANQNIPQGAALTTQNMDNAFNENISFENTGKLTPLKAEKKDQYFMGYPRKDGSVGTQNVWLFFPLVFCENRNIELLKTVFEREFYPEKMEEHQHFLRSLIQGKTEKQKPCTFTRPLDS